MTRRGKKKKTASRQAQTIHKARAPGHRPTRVHEEKSDYKRSEARRKTRKEIEEEGDESASS